MNHRIAALVALLALGCASPAEPPLGKSSESVIPSGSLLGYWKLDETSGTTAVDSSGNGLNGTYSSSPTRIAGKVGNALSFDGSDAVNIGNPAGILNVSKLTMAAWVKRLNVNSPIRIGKQANGQDLTIEAEFDGLIYLQCSNGGDAGGTFPLNDTAWHHITLVFDGTQSGNAARLKAYRDGVQQTLTFHGTIPTTTTKNTQTFRIGRIGSSYSEGSIDEVLVYSRALSAVEVTQLFQNGTQADTTPPSTPQGVAASAVTFSSLTLSWTASTDNVGVAGYRVLRNGTLVGSPATTTFADSALSPSTSYQYTVAAVDAAGNASGPSTTLSVTTAAPPPDTTPPSTPQGLNAAAVTQTSLTVSWTASTDNVGVTGYRVLRNGTLVASPTTTTFADSGLSPSTTYQYTVAAGDAAGNISSASSVLSVKTAATADTTPPSTPQGLAASGVTQTSLTLSWTASTDNIAVTGYRVFRNGTLVGSPTTMTFPDAGLSPATTYQYTVRAVDAAGNTSSASVALPVTTQAPTGDTTPPTCTVTAPGPGTLAGIITFSASASDNVGVTSVGFEVNGVERAVNSTAPYSVQFDTRTLTDGSHVLSAHAHDAAGNEGESQTVTVVIGNGANAFVNEVMATGVTLPTNLEFLPSGAIIVGELGGRIRYLPPGATQPSATDFMQITNIGANYSGLMDMILNPDFATNGWFYVSYTRGNPIRDRVSRFTASGATASLASETVIWEGTNSADGEHHGLGLAFDGASPPHLFITVGEHFLGDPAQDLSSELGKVLRVNKDGSIPTDNPFYDGAGSHADRVYAIGLRSPFRSFFDAPTGRLFVGDVGGNDPSNSYEEVNVILPGANYGWPNCEGNCGAPSYVQPFYTYPHSGRDACVTNGFVYHGSVFPAEYRGSYFFGDFAQNWIKRIVFNADGSMQSVQNVMPTNGQSDTGAVGSVVHLVEGPDGALWYTSIGDIDSENQLPFIGRIRYISGNRAPIAQSSGTPLQGPIPLTVTFSSAGSNDPDGSALTYSWDFGDGQTSTAPNPSHGYGAGNFTVRLSVSDGSLTTLAAPLYVTAGNPPVPAVELPVNGSTFRAGDLIQFMGSATDQEDGSIPPSGLAWNIDFHHLTHVHPGSPITGQASGTFTIPLTGHDYNTQTSYELRLTATDSSGLYASQSTMIYPDKANLVFSTVPSGLTITLDGVTKTTPLTYDDLIGFNHIIAAPTQTVGNVTYTFSGWSDGGAQSHLVVVPAASVSLVATFTSTQAPLPTGLVAAYSMNATSGTVVADATGKGHTGTLAGTGATWTTTGKSGGGIAFNGSSGTVTVADAADLHLGSFTLSAWVKLTDTSGYKTVLIKEKTAVCGYWLEIAGDELSQGFNGGSGCLEHAGGVITAAQWSHVAVAFDDAANTSKGYVNGVLTFNEAETHSPVQNTEPLIMGQSAGGERMKGTLDEVHVYNRALSQAEVSQDMSYPGGQ